MIWHAPLIAVRARLEPLICIICMANAWKMSCAELQSPAETLPKRNNVFIQTLYCKVKSLDYIHNTDYRMRHLN